MPSRRRRYRARPKSQPNVKKPPANAEINADEVRLIGPEGEQLGVVPTAEAAAKAAETESDLVLVADKANPPVARIMDLGKHLYDQRKKITKQRAHNKGGDVKGVRISFKIGANDLAIRHRRAAGFLDEGNKVKVEMRLRGREKGRVELAKDKLREFIAEIPGGAEIDGSMSGTHNSISAVIVRPKKPVAA